MMGDCSVRGESEGEGDGRGLALFSDVKALGAIWIVVATAEKFAEDRIVAAKM